MATIDKTAIAVELGARKPPQVVALENTALGVSFVPPLTLKMTLVDTKRLRFYGVVVGETQNAAGQVVGERMVPLAGPTGKLREFSNIDDAVRAAARIFGVADMTVEIANFPTPSETLTDPKAIATRERAALTRQLASYTENLNAANTRLADIAAWASGSAAQRARYQDAVLTKDALVDAVAVTTARIDALSAIINA